MIAAHVIDFIWFYMRIWVFRFFLQSNPTEGTL